MSSQTDLAGLLVVSVEQAVAAPYAASRLADAGARVIKIERDEGDFARRYDKAVDGESAYFVWLSSTSRMPGTRPSWRRWSGRRTCSSRTSRPAP